jgi:hypothetical protein
MDYSHAKYSKKKYIVETRQALPHVQVVTEFDGQQDFINYSVEVWCAVSKIM